MVCNFFYDGFNKDELIAELSTLYELYHSVVEDAPLVDNIKSVLLTISAAQRMLLNNVCPLFQLLLILLATNANSE